MTSSDEELVRQALERAAAGAPAMSLDVAEQLRRGARRRRARRWGASAATVACVAVLGVGGAAAVGHVGPWEAPPVAGPGEGGTPPVASSPAPSPSETAPAALTDAELLRAFEIERSDEETLADMRTYQEAIAACMHAAGFEYVPDVPEKLSHPVDPVRDEAWYAAWGLGISIDGTAAYPDAVWVPDPNEPYVTSLSEDERRAYDDALWGTEGNDNLGCTVEAFDAVPEDPRPATPQLVVELSQQATLATNERLAADPQLADAVATLAQCAADAGAADYDPYAVPGSTDATVRPRLYLPWQPHAQVEDAWAQLNATGAPEPAALAQFQQWERDIAVAAHRCNAPVYALADEINAAVLHEVVAPRRAELEALLAAWPNG